MDSAKVAIMVMTLVRSALSVVGKDVCYGKQSRLSCGTGEVIMMTSAEYGHMTGGRCIVNESPRYAGCRNDVLPLFDRWCSGRKECSFDTSSAELEALNVNCPTFIIKYTRLQHSCVKVNTVCRTDKPTSGYLSSYASSKGLCGSSSSPWTITARPGQTIHLELIDFSAASRNSDLVSCRVVHGFILEKSLGINRTICGGDLREAALYTSKTNSVDIQFVKRNPNSGGEFLVKYEVLGCAELLPPAHAWYKREGNKASIGCESNDKEWTLTCSENVWLGEIGNCTDTVIKKAQPIPTKEKLAFTSVIIMAAIIGGAFVVSVVAVVIGVVYVKKYRMHQETKRASLMHKTYSTMGRNIQAYYRPEGMNQLADSGTPWDISPSLHPECQTLSAAEQCTCATLQMRNNTDSDKRTEITSLERQSLYSSIKSN